MLLITTKIIKIFLKINKKYARFLKSFTLLQKDIKENQKKWGDSPYS